MELVPQTPRKQEPRTGLDVVVVVPTLDERESIVGTIEEIRQVLRAIRSEILVVDGRSSDGTDQIALAKGVNVIYQRNTGYGDALHTGFLHVRRNMDARAIVMMDADSTYDARDIPSLVEPILEGRADMVVGNRFPRLEKGAMTRMNQIGNRLLSWVSRSTLKLIIHDTQCGLRAFCTSLVDDMDLDSEGMPFATEMIADAHFARARITEAPVAYRPRVGRPKLSPFRDGLRILGTIIRLVRDTKPLLFFGVSGAILGILGLVFGAQVTLEWLETGTVRKLPTVMLSVLLLIGSMQLLTLGLVADMIKRMRARRNRHS